MPFAFKTPIKAITANIVGAVVSGGLVSLFQIRFYGGLGSPLGAYIGYGENNFYGLAWIFSILAGALTTGILFGLLTSKNAEHEKAYLLKKEEKIKIYHEKGHHTKWSIYKHKMTNVIYALPKKLKYAIVKTKP